MARDFDGTTDYLTTAALPVAAYPLTMACWFRPRGGWADALMWIGDTGATNQRIILDLTGNNVRAFAQSGGTSSNAISTGGGGALDVWDHACGVWASDTDRRAFRSGGLKGTIAAARPFPTNADLLSVGMGRESVPAGDFNGRIAEAGVWNVALTDAEVAALASGVSPLLVRTGSLVFYAPLWGNDSPEPDYNPGGTTRFPLTLNGSLAQVGHPPVAPMFFEVTFATAGAGATTVSLGVAAETDTAEPLDGAKAATVGFPTVVNTVAAFNNQDINKSVYVDFGAEADTAGALHMPSTLVAAEVADAARPLVFGHLVLLPRVFSTERGRMFYDEAGGGGSPYGSGPYGGGPYGFGASSSAGVRGRIRAAVYG